MASCETSNLKNSFKYKISVELPWSIKTLDTIKLAITTNKAMGSS